MEQVVSNSAMIGFLLASLAILLAFVLRSVPRSISKNVGVDQWFWKSYVRAYKESGKFPPDIKQYLLDEHQWYPPVFPLFLARFSLDFLDRYGYWASVVLDLLRLIMVMAFGFFVLDFNIFGLFICGLVYATAPILISYNVQLNPRVFGAILLDLFLFALVIQTMTHFNPLFAIFIGVCASVILLTHKMTTQLFWFICLSASVFFFSYLPFLFIPGSIFLALVLSKGFYLKVLWAHYDIVAFWYRNWPWLQAHPIRESPIYGEENYESPQRHHKKGLKGVLKHLKLLVGFFPFGWILTFLIVAIHFFGGSAVDLPQWLVWWFISIQVFSLATVFINPLKCLGSGYLYQFNLVTPAALIWTKLLDSKESGTLIIVAFLTGLLLNLISVCFFYMNLHKNREKSLDENLQLLLNELNKLPAGAVMFLPAQWYDMIAFNTEKSVLYGGHGYGFRLLEPVFPVLRLSTKELAENYNLRYLLTTEGYLNKKFLDSIEPKNKIDFGLYQIIEI